MTDVPLRRPDVLAWDAPTRLFKWSLAVLVLAQPLMKAAGGPTLLSHRMTGYVILTLVLWRLLWGVFGGSTARFSAFVRSPVAAFGYAADLARGRPRRFLGHNPLGAFMILALMAAVTAQGVAGLFTSDDIFLEGPFGHLVPREFVKAMSVWHDRGYLLILALVAVHVSANVFYSVFKRDNLIGAMLTGRKPAGAYEDAAEAEPGSWAVAAGLAVVAGVIVWGGLALFGIGAFV